MACAYRLLHHRTARCAPPDNSLYRVNPDCRGYMEREIPHPRTESGPGTRPDAWDAYLEVLKQRGLIASRAPYQFAHAAEVQLPTPAPQLSASIIPASKTRKPDE